MNKPKDKRAAQNVARGATPYRLPLSAKLCRAKTKAGKPCPCPPMVGKKFCFYHVPGNASRVGTKGGHRRAIYAPEGLAPISEVPDKATDVRKLLGISMLEVRAGRLDPKVANTLAYLANAFFAALETERHDTLLAGLVAQVAKLEADAERAAGRRNR